MLKPHAAQDSLAATPVRRVIGPLDRQWKTSRMTRGECRRLFAALRGEKTDGHEFIGQTIDKARR
jgi:UDP-N-acetylmuramyl pentapeptide synthase